MDQADLIPNIWFCRGEQKLGKTNHGSQRRNTVYATRMAFPLMWSKHSGHVMVMFDWWSQILKWTANLANDQSALAQLER